MELLELGRVTADMSIAVSPPRAAAFASFNNEHKRKLWRLWWDMKILVSRTERNGTIHPVELSVRRKLKKKKLNSKLRNEIAKLRLLDARKA